MTPFINNEMNLSSFWKNKCKNNKGISFEQIQNINRKTLDSPYCGMNNIFNKVFQDQKIESLENDKNILMTPIKEHIKKFCDTLEESNYMNIEKLRDDAMHIAENLCITDADHRYAVISRTYLTMRTIPIKDDIGINNILDFFSITDVLENEPVYVSGFSNDGSTLYIYTRYANGWITVTPKSDIRFLPKKDWQKLESIHPKLPLNEHNILDVALSYLGHRYNWGSIFDCSGFVRHIYSYFGLSIPNNTRKQAEMPCKKYMVSDISTKEKKDILDQLPVGSILYMGSHAALFIGKHNDRYYVIGSVGSYIDPSTKLLISPRSVMISTLDFLRSNGLSWLESTNIIIIPWLED